MKRPAPLGSPKGFSVRKPLVVAVERAADGEHVRAVQQLDGLLHPVIVPLAERQGIDLEPEDIGLAGDRPGGVLLVAALVLVVFRVVGLDQLQLVDFAFLEELPVNVLGGAVAAAIDDDDFAGAAADEIQPVLEDGAVDEAVAEVGGNHGDVIQHVAHTFVAPVRMRRARPSVRR